MWTREVINTNDVAPGLDGGNVFFMISSGRRRPLGHGWDQRMTMGRENRISTRSVSCQMLPSLARGLIENRIQPSRQPSSVVVATRPRA